MALHSTETLHQKSLTPGIYFPNLNALRIYAAVCVVIAHTALNFAELRATASIYPLLDALSLDAQTAVSLFFVLSGFLITYLLLAERDQHGAIAIRQFYFRRMLRIWPLYFLIAILGFVLLPLLLGPSYALYDAPVRSIVLVMVMLPNLVGPLGPLGHLWTIGLEEQFYLVWPWAVRRQSVLLKVIAGIVILKLALAPIVYAFNDDAMLNLFLGTRFECMALGGLAAWLYHRQHPLLRWLYSIPVMGLVSLSMVYLMLVDIPVTPLNNALCAVLFATLILNLATNPRLPLRLQGPFWDRLGNLSYGVYMYHFPLLYLVLYALHTLKVPEGESFNAILYGTTLSGTFIAASLSYRFFERPFLALKRRLAMVPSASSAEDAGKQAAQTA
jgi:peptidoglycan/LPS O-acetylase OafA/YrhL